MRRWRTGLSLAAALLPSLHACAEPAADAAYSEADAHCLALSLYWEAKNEGREGMIAVGWVVKNRMAHAEFPDAPCDVVYEGGETPPCQFSWWCDGKSDRPDEPDNWALAQEVATELLDDPPRDPTGGALFFHSADIGVPWAVERSRTARVGNHVYYR